MFPHSLSSSPLVISSKGIIEVLLKSSGKRCKLSLDSANTISINKEDLITIKQSNKYLKLIHPLDHSFYGAYRNKLGWGIGIIKKSN